MVIMSRHVQDDLNSFSDEDCFLNTSVAFQPATNSEAKLEGNYLYHNEKKGFWSRSGSVSSGGGSGPARSFAVQHSEHEKSAMRRGGSGYNSTFYARYPNKASEHADNPFRSGYFDGLKQYVGLGVDPSKKKVSCCSDTAGDATTLFVWTKDNLKDINNVQFRGCNRLEEKQYKMIAYAFEKAYDLLISPARNVSRNPGFETPLGFFG
jgi:hypothetical protein